MEDHLLIGAHLSIQGGIQNALLEGYELHCSAVQIFTANNRQWHFKALSDDAVEQFYDVQNRVRMHVVSHACYLINIGSPTDEVRYKSHKALIGELKRCSQLQIPATVLHPGSYLKGDKELSIKRIADILNDIYADETLTCKVALETMAGQGSTIGSSLEELNAIMEQLNPYARSKVGICVDTCHIFSAGYDISHPAGYKEFWDSFYRYFNTEDLLVIHMNNSKFGCGCRKDRHEHLAEGQITPETFWAIMNDKRFTEIPKILETPVETIESNEKNLNFLRSSVSKNMEIWYS